MGTFLGHLLPGTLLALQAFAWWIQFLWTSYFSSNPKARTCTETFEDVAIYSALSTDPASTDQSSDSFHTSSPSKPIDALRSKSLRQSQHQSETIAPSTTTVTHSEANEPSGSETIRSADGVVRRNCLHTPLAVFGWILDAEPLIRIFVPILGIIGESHNAHWEMNWHDEDNLVGHVSHISLYIAFIISGLFDVFDSRGRFRPHGTSSTIVIFAFAVEGLIFYGHAMMQEQLEQRTHNLLLTAIFGVSLCLVLEVLLADQAAKRLCKIARIYFGFLQGIWMIVLGTLLYRDDWRLTYEFLIDDMNKRMEVVMRHQMILSLIFSWIAMGVLLGMGVTLRLSQALFYHDKATSFRMRVPIAILPNDTKHSDTSQLELERCRLTAPTALDDCDNEDQRLDAVL